MVIGRTFPSNATCIINGQKLNYLRLKKVNKPFQVDAIIFLDEANNYNPIDQNLFDEKENQSWIHNQYGDVRIFCLKLKLNAQSIAESTINRTLLSI